MLGLLSSYDKNIVTVQTFFIALALAILFAFLLPFRFKTALNSRVRHAIDKSGDENILSPTQLIIDENGISGKNKVAEVKYQWNAFIKKVVRNKCYYLYTSLIHAVVIPERAFNNREEKKEFETILSQHLPLNAELPFNKLK